MKTVEVLLEGEPHLPEASEVQKALYPDPYVPRYTVHVFTQS